MQQLNLPFHPTRIKREGDRELIFDPIRKKYVILTPEEWVRQNLIQHLIIDHRYPKSLIKVEFGIKYNQLRKRPDIIVYDRQGAPFLLVECKSPTVSITNETLFQVSTYNKTISARYVILSNGLEHVCFTTLEKTGKLNFMQSFPRFGA